MQDVQKKRLAGGAFCISMNPKEMGVSKLALNG
jgi:hypothetical protein